MATFRTRIFKSGGGSLRIVVKPGMPQFEGGVKVGDKPGVYADFVGGEFVTKDKEVIEKLRSLPTFGIDFIEVTDEDEKAGKNAGSENADQSGDDGGDQSDPRAELEKLTKSQLQELAQERGITLDANLKKAEIIDALINAQK